MRLGRCEVCAELRDQLAVERARVEILMAEALKMHREGFQPPPQYAKGPATTKGVSPELLAQVEHLSAGRGPLRAYMRADVGSLVAKGEDDAAIIKYLHATYTGESD